MIARSLKLFGVDWSKEIYLHDLRKTFPWQTATVDAVYTSHTLEHLDKDEGLRFLKECHRVLTPNGTIRVVVPDLKPIVDRYTNGEMRADEFLESLDCLYRFKKRFFKNLLIPYLQFPHKCMYDPETLLQILSEIGFDATKRAGMDSDIEGIQEIERLDRTVNAVVIEGRKLAD